MITRKPTTSAPTTRGWVALGVLALALVGGCASVDPYAHEPIRGQLAREDEIGACARLLQRVDAAIDAAGSRDAESPRLPGRPQLRSDRVTASLANEAAASQEAAWAWRARMREHDHHARRVELANGGTQRIDPRDAAAAEACAQRLAQADADLNTGTGTGTGTDTDAGTRDLAALAVAARVEDHYSDLSRVLGVYPLSRMPFAAGVRRWQRGVLDSHASSTWPRHGSVRRYGPAHASVTAPSRFDRDALGLPRLDGSALDALFARHAPLLELDVRDDADLLGAPAWSRDGTVVTRSADPVLYKRLTHTRLGGRWLPQLVYTFWFPERPSTGRFDILAGRLDGIVWRVTLGEDLQPLLYDTIHPCGCYHLFYPTPRVREREGATRGEHPLDEALFVPQRVATPSRHERAVLRLDSHAHELAGVSHARMESFGSATAYRLDDEQVLRTLPWPDEHALRAAWPAATRSLYRPDGLVDGTQRLERWLFWPMGIASAGQMRQWGHHATAFVGRRHFDDPTLFDRYFELTDSSGIRRD